MKNGNESYRRGEGGGSVKKIPQVNCQVRVAGHQPTSGRSRRCYCRTWGRACRIERNRPLGCCSKEKRKTARKWWACSRLRESSDAAGPRRPSLSWPDRRPASVPGAPRPHHTTRMKTPRCWWTLADDWRNCSRVATFLAIRRSKAFQSHCGNQMKLKKQSRSDLRCVGRLTRRFLKVDPLPIGR